MTDPILPNGGDAAGRATAGVQPVVLYDGECEFCVEQAGRLKQLARNAVRLKSLHEPGSLSACPGLTVEACMQEIKLVETGGAVYGGVEALIRAVKLGRPILGRLFFLYYVPGIRQVADRIYARVATNRYRHTRLTDQG